MRVIKVIVICIAAAISLYVFYYIIAFALFIFRPSPYLRFMGKDAAYYTDVAHACDVVLKGHPVISSNAVAHYQGVALPYTLKLSGDDISLPAIIRALHPDTILVSSNLVWIEIPPERRGGFILTWEPDYMRTNFWALQSNGDGSVKTVYEENR